MSVVACRILPDGYEIASDSITIRWATQSKGENTKFSKLFEVNGLVIGCVGSAEESSLLQMYCKTRQPAAANEQDLLEFMSEFANWKKTKVSKSDIDNHYLIGFEGKVFSIGGWFIQEVLKYEAIGAGMDYALAALYLGNSAHDAIKVACELSIFCEEPIQVISKVKEKVKSSTAAKKRSSG